MTEHERIEAVKRSRIAARNPSSVLEVTPYDESPFTIDLVQCCHCGLQFMYIKGSGRMRGYCRNCKQITCGGQACDVCTPQLTRDGL